LDDVLLSCFFPVFVIAIRVDKRARRDPVDGVLLVTVLLELELFSLSLELRSMDALRFVVDVVLTMKNKRQ
jgi:hypothetical protein